MRHPLWSPSPERIKNSNMTRFMEFVNRRYNRQFTGYFDLYEWSVANIADLWASLWDFLDIKASKKYEKVVDDLSKFPGARWFVGAEMNFAENLLRYRDERTAFVFKCEAKPSVSITYGELYHTVARLAALPAGARGDRERPRCGVHAEYDGDGDCHAGRHQHRRHLGILRLRVGDAGGHRPLRPDRPEGALCRRRVSLQEQAVFHARRREGSRRRGAVDRKSRGRPLRRAKTRI